MLKINKKVVLIFILSLLVLLEGLNPFFVLAKTSNDLNVNVEELQDGKVYLGELNLSVKNIKENGQIIIPKEYFNINNEELKKLEEELIDDNTLEDEENIRAKKEKKFIEEDENNFILNISNDYLILKLEAIKKGDTFIEVKDISQYEKVDLQVGDSFINDSDNISDPSSENADNSTLLEEDAENENDKNDGNSSDVVDDTTDYVEQEEPMDNIVITEEPIEVSGDKFKVENITNSEDEINNFSKNIVTNYEMYCSDPDSKLEDGDITIDISIVSDSGKKIASINNFTKKSEMSGIIKSSTDKNGRVSYVLNKPTPGNRYVFSVQTSAMSIAEKGDSYRIKLDFNIKGNEREYFSEPILINFENEDSDIITEENSKWTMNFKDGETLKLNRGGEGAKWYHIKNGGNQSFENLKIKYEYKDEKSISRLTAYTSADLLFGF